MFLKAGLFSAVSSAFVIDVQSKLQPDPNEQSAALLRAILITLNQSAIPDGNPAAPLVPEDPPHEIVTATGLMYASLLISLLAAFVAMLGKQWLNRYLRHEGGSAIERCGDRQCKHDGLEKWPFHLFVESLPVMLQLSLLLLACGLCRYTWSINTSVAYILITLTVLGMMFYLAIVVSGTSSYECPFQTPASTRLRGLWKRIRSHKTLPARQVVAIGHLWDNAARPIIFATNCFKAAITQMTLSFNQQVHVPFRSHPHVNRLPPAISLEDIREDSCVTPEPNSPIHIADSSHHDSNSSHHDSNSPAHSVAPSSLGALTYHPGNVGPWLTWGDLTVIQKTNVKDVRCVSWILRNITDLEALEAAIRLAGIILWFEDGLNVEPPYNVIVSIFHSCLDSTGTVYPGLLDRAYHSARAMLWIHILALCVSEEFACNFPLPHVNDMAPDHWDLSSLLRMFNMIQVPRHFVFTWTLTESNTVPHMQWVSHALLHFCWAKGGPDALSIVPFRGVPHVPLKAIPLDAALNIFLAWSILLGTPVEDEALKIQDKTCAIFNFPPHNLHCRF